MSPSPGSLVPFRWPATWSDPALLKLLEGSPINCLLFEELAGAGPVAAAARAAGLTAIEASALRAAPLASIEWTSPAAQVVISGLAWPRIKLSARQSSGVDAGPTGAPWIDSNTWVARLAAVRAPNRPVWLAFEHSKDDPVPGEAAYINAIADSAASGARWIIALDDNLVRGLPAANSGALKIWRGIVTAVAFFEKRRDRAAWKPWGSIGILSSFSGKDEFIGQEILNLAARRNLLYRVLDRSIPATIDLEGLPAVLCVDSELPDNGLKAELVAFARSGGLLIVPRPLEAQFPGEKTVRCPVAGYTLKSLGKGKVATAARDWDDPYFLAADVHNLVGRRNDPATLFNAGSLWEHYSIAPDGRGALLQLVAFAGRTNESVSLAAARPWRSAQMHTIARDLPVILEPVAVEGTAEFHLPAFSYYAALEFRP